MLKNINKKRAKVFAGLFVGLFVFAIIAQSCSMTTACGTTKSQAKQKHKKWR